MLRSFALLLLVANGFFYAWSNGHLSQWGWVASSQRETFRLNEQIEPERIVVRQTGTSTTLMPTPSAPTSMQAPVVLNPMATAATSTTCLTAGVFNDKQSGTLKQALNAQLPNIPWRFDTSNVPARWIVYMGQYANNNTRDQKKTQLDQIKVPYEALMEGKLEPGISLGSHATQAQANQALQKLLKQGVRTARVLQETSEQKGQTLVVPSLDQTNRAKLNTLYANLSSQIVGKPLQACKN